MMKEKDRTIEEQNRRLRYYENENSPPSAESLEYKRQKAQRKRERASNRGNGSNSGTGKKPGGQRGHKGTSRRHDPQKTVLHTFQDNDGTCSPVCMCGRAMDITALIRDIIDFEPVRMTETRHITERATCRLCGIMISADDGLPRRGRYGKHMISLVSALRARHMPLQSVADTLKDFTGRSIAKSTVINMIGGVCDSMQKPSGAILGGIKRSSNVRIDETAASMNGSRIWTWTAETDNGVFVEYNTSRGALFLDRHMDKYGGIVTSDKYSVYDRFNGEDRHQLCWSHELRVSKYAAQKQGAPLFAGILYEQLRQLYRSAVRARRKDRGKDLRRRFESWLRNILFGYRESTDDPVLGPVLRRLTSSLPHLFTFLEHDNVHPTNNAAERALRYAVVFRKISGQIKGGELWMRRWSQFMTCILTWRARGRSVADEVMKLV